ncbi:MAG: phosphoserine phosphatase [Akkermansiaceae bacterium]|jgi:phosphoserine phosphatase
MKKIIAFDCDSTLSSIEGVDELARLSDSNIFQEVERLTHQAMNGEVPVEEVFGRRLALIQPTKDQCTEIGERYLETIEPTAKATIAALQTMGWECLIISGGFLPCIRPLAQSIGIERVEAVPIFFDEKGDYLGFDENYPTTRSGGKPEIIKLIRKESSPDIMVMVGDGVSDLETKPHVDHFVGFSRYVERNSVATNCMHNVFSMAELLGFIKNL